MFWADFWVTFCAEPQLVMSYKQKQVLKWLLGSLEGVKTTLHTQPAFTRSDRHRFSGLRVTAARAAESSTSYGLLPFPFSTHRGSRKTAMR